MKVRTSEFVKGIRGTDPIVTDIFPQFAFVGRSNVGKSSLINALCNKKALVKVSDRPGKTTEINYFLINNEAYFADLPGYGYASVSPEEKEKLKKLIIWYLTASGAQPKLVTIVVDAKVGITEFDLQMIEILKEYGHPFVVAANKIDKLSQKDLSAQLAKIALDAAPFPVIPTSAVERGGTVLLQKRLG